MDGAVKMQIGEVPDPLRPIAQDHSLLGSAPAAIPSFGIEALSEFLGGLDGTCVGGRVWVANRKAFLVPAGLGKDAAQFDFPGMSRLTVDFARPTFGLGAHHGYAGAIELDIDHGNGVADWEGQIQLPGLLYFLLLACGNVSANRLRSAFDCLGGDLQAGQAFHLFAPVVEGSVVADYG